MFQVKLNSMQLMLLANTLQLQHKHLDNFMFYLQNKGKDISQLNDIKSRLAKLTDQLNYEAKQNKQNSVTCQLESLTQEWILHALSFELNGATRFLPKNTAESCQLYSNYVEELKAIAKIFDVVLQISEPVIFIF